MRKQLQGIGLILFGILLCLGGDSINFAILTDIGYFPFVLLGVCIGIAGQVLLFIKGE